MSFLNTGLEGSFFLSVSLSSILFVLIRHCCGVDEENGPDVVEENAESPLTIKFYLLLV